MEQVFIENGDKYEPLQRFNLKAAKASTAFGTSQSSNSRFEVRRHPVVQSINANTVNRSGVTASARVDAPGRPASASRPASSTVARPTGNARGGVTASARVDAPGRPASVNRPTNSTVARPTGTTGSRPSGTVVNRPVNTAVNRPTGTTVNRPTNSTVSRPTGTTGSRPTGSTVARPTGTTGSRPSGTVVNRPVNTAVNRPVNTAVNRPVNTAVNRPTTNTVSRPTSSTVSRPSSSTVSRPTSDTIRRPSTNTSAGSRPPLTGWRPGFAHLEAMRQIKLGQIVGALLNRKQNVLEPEYPVIKEEGNLTSNTKLTCVDGSSRMIPDVELMPHNGRLFYYEDVNDSDGKHAGYVGYVSIKYGFFCPSPTVKMLATEVDSAKLNLKTNNDSFVIEGTIDHRRHSIRFNLKDEAVKIAFCNLGSQIDAMKCDVDIYYKFSGYSVQKTNLKVYRPIARRTETALRRAARLRINVPTVVRAVEMEKRKLKSETPLYVKSSFIVKTRKSLNYPLDHFQQLYQCFSGTISGNPFQLNDDFSEYQRVTCLSPKYRDLVEVYKSLFAKNSFLLFPKRYYIARNAQRACIYSTCFLNEEGITEKQQELSKVNFSFDVAPALSEYDLAQLRMELYENGLLDKDMSGEVRKNMIFDEITFNFPNDIGAESSINGNEFFSDASIVKDGQYFNIICETEKLSSASMFITNINSARPWYFNINSKYKDIENSATVELDILKTIGEFLDWEVSDDGIVITNNSYSPCSISSMMLFTSDGECLENSDIFKEDNYLESFQTRAIDLHELTDNPAFLNPEIAFFKYESIENIADEFRQAIDELSSYYRNIVLDFSGLDDDVESLEVDIKHVSTGCVYNFLKERKEFEMPLNLSIIMKNEVETVTQLEITRKFRDRNGNSVREDCLNWDYSKSALIDLSLPSQD